MVFDIQTSQFMSRVGVVNENIVYIYNTSTSSSFLRRLSMH